MPSGKDPPFRETSRERVGHPRGVLWREFWRADRSRCGLGCATRRKTGKSIRVRHSRGHDGSVAIAFMSAKPFFVEPERHHAFMQPIIGTGSSDLMISDKSSCGSPHDFFRFDFRYPLRQSRGNRISRGLTDIGPSTVVENERIKFLAHCYCPSPSASKKRTRHGECVTRCGSSGGGTFFGLRGRRRLC